MNLSQWQRRIIEVSSRGQFQKRIRLKQYLQTNDEKNYKKAKTAKSL